jgi:hypothetical protein
LLLVATNWIFSTIAYLLNPYGNKAGTLVESAFRPYTLLKRLGILTMPVDYLPLAS